MIIAAFNPETTDLERTYLSQYTAEGSATIQIKNTDNFATNKTILIGKMGGERSELIATDGITPPSTLSLDGVTLFPHNADDPVYLMRWNQIKFYRSSTETGSYTLVDTVAIDVDNSDGVTKYDDAAGTGTDFYKVKYYNSITAVLSDFSDPIQATGYGITTAGNIIDQVVRRVRDTNYEILAVEDYIDIMNEVNSDLLMQSHKPYRFLKTVLTIDTVAGQNYIDLATVAPNFWKFNYLEYSWTVGGVTHTYQITQPLSAEDFARKYDNTNYLDNDELIDIAIDEDRNRILLGPAPKTSQSDVITLHYYAKFDQITGTGSVLQTPTNLVYRYKLMAEYYSAKAETDRQWNILAEKYENKYGNEVVKMQRVNRVDTGTPRSFAPKRVPGMRKRYYL